MAIGLSLVLFILFATYELARANFMRHAARAAAYEGARIGILPGTDEAKIREGVDFVLHTMGVRQADVVITPATFDVKTPRVRVDVTIDANKNLFFAPFFMKNARFVGNCELSREVL